MTQTVALHTAFVWTCDRCGRDNFERSVKFEPEMLEGYGPDRESQRQIAKLRAAGVDVGGEWVTTPKQVTCKHCGGQFGVEE